MASSSPWILNLQVNSFEEFDQQVVQRSHQLLVVVDFWATWCGPCQELGPVLEKLAVEYNGKFLLVKVDVDQNQEIAQAFGVTNIPQVAALYQGQLVHQFQGNLPEDQIRQWLQQILPSPADTLAAEAQLLEEMEPQQAEAKYRAALELNPDESHLQIGLARALLAQGRTEETRSILDKLNERGYLEPEAEHVKAQLELQSTAAEAGDITDLRHSVAASPGDLPLQLKLAETLAAHKQYSEALELCLSLIRKDKAQMLDPAKQAMLNIFQVLGPASELTQTFRRQLSTLLY
ncbi:MAG: thioredoxin [Planctomycetales bacterium]